MLYSGLRLQKTQSLDKDERTKRRAHIWRFAFRRDKSKGARQSKRGTYATLSSLSSGVPGPASVKFAKRMITTAANDDFNTVGGSSITPVSRPSRTHSAAVLPTSAPAAEPCGAGCTGDPGSIGLPTVEQTEAEAQLCAEAEAYAALLTLARLRLASASSMASHAHLGDSHGQTNGGVTDAAKVREATGAARASGAAPGLSATQQSSERHPVHSSAGHAPHIEDDDVCAAIVAEAMAAVHRAISAGNSKPLVRAQDGSGVRAQDGRAQDGSGVEVTGAHSADGRPADQPEDHCEHPDGRERKDLDELQSELQCDDGVGPTATTEPTAVAETGTAGATKAKNGNSLELERIPFQIECSMHEILREIEEAVAYLSVAPANAALSQSRHQSEGQKFAKDRWSPSSSPQQPPTRPQPQSPTRLPARSPSSRNTAHSPSALSTPSPIVEGKTAAAPSEAASVMRTGPVSPHTPASQQSTERLPGCKRPGHAASAGATPKETSPAREASAATKTRSASDGAAVTMSTPLATRHKFAISPSDSRNAAAVRLQKSVRGMQVRDELRRSAEDGREDWIRYYLQRGEYWEAKALGWKGSEQSSECAIS